MARRGRLWARPRESAVRPGGFERWVAPYFREPSLWPVMLVLVAHAVLGLGIALLEVRRGAGGFAWLSVALGVACLAGAAVRDARRGSAGLASGICLSIWALSVATAWLADRYDLY